MSNILGNLVSSIDFFIMCFSEQRVKYRIYSQSIIANNKILKLEKEKLYVKIK